LDTAQLYDTFRLQHRELATDTDRRHAEFWEDADDYGSHLWFESLAKEINVWMGAKEKHAAIGAAFKYFDEAHRRGDKQVRNRIDVGLVENLFWQVQARNTGPGWAMLPPSLQQLYIAFHRRPPDM